MSKFVLTSGLEPDYQRAEEGGGPALQRGHQERVTPVAARPEHRRGHMMLAFKKHHMSTWNKIYCQISKRQFSAFSATYPPG